MWTCGKHAGCVLLATVLTCAAEAQPSPKKSAVALPARTTKPHAALLAPDDGMGVIAAALETRGRDAKTDCSHLVHEIYERAGFSYAYMPSSEIYLGSEEFRRVTHPQPGDLVVWPGHVGILVSPAQHSFFSALNSGLGVDSYDSTYWKERGRPRFLRFVKQASSPNRVANRDVPGLKNTVLQTHAGGAPLEANPQEVSRTVPEVPERTPAEVVVPRILVETAKPTPEQISAALLQAMDKTGDALRGQDIFQLKRELKVVRRFEVRQVKIGSDRGSAEMQMEESASVTAGQLNLKKRRAKQRWILVRIAPDKWELLPPQPNLYMNHDDAVQVFAHQLAEMTDSGGSSQDVARKAQVALLLQTLLPAKN